MHNSIITSIVVNSLLSLRRLHQSLHMYTLLGPYSKTLSLKTKDIMQLNTVIMPTHCREFERLVTFYKIQPPLSLCGLHKPTLTGALAHLSLAQAYAEQILAQMIADCGERLNDSIRELNEHELQQKLLRTALINCRNSIDRSSTLFPSNQYQNKMVSRAIKWLF